MKSQKSQKESSIPEDKRAEKINQDDNYLSYNILKEIIKETNIPKKIIEEKNSELFYETLTGKGSVTFINNTKYTGLMKNGLLESGPDKEICQIIFEDGTKYEGEIHQNKISGQGKYTFPSGAIYEGSLLNGLRHGLGKYKSPEGITYEGDWKNGLKEGKGIMKRGNMSYEGEWKGGRISGKGKIKWENGNIYEGEFKMNHIEGNGYMVWYDLLEKYIGKWKNDKQNGLGIHIWYEPKGELKEMRNRYVGEWEEGIRQGYGVFFYSNGAMYEGEWKNNMKHGFGIMKFEDGKKYIGRFEEDRIIDKDEQLTFEMVRNLLKEYNLNKINEIKEENNDNDDNNKVNNINNIYQIVQMKKNKEKEEVNNISVSPMRNNTKKLKSLSTFKNNSKINPINSKDKDNNNSRINPINSKDKDNNNNSKVNPINSKDVKDNTKKNLINSKDTSKIIQPNNKSKEKSSRKESSSMIVEDKGQIKSNLRAINNVSNMNISNNISIMGNTTMKKLGNLDSLSPFSKTKYAQNPNSKIQRFIPIFDLSDLIQEDPSISSDLDEISKVILRNLSFLKTIYRYLNKIAKADLISEETNSSKLIIRDDLKPQESPTINSKKKNNLLNRSSIKKTGKQATNPTVIININKKNKMEDNIRSDELSFCISMLDVWCFLRDGGILNENASICEFNRLFALSNNAFSESYQLPEDINEPKEIYDYIYKKIKETKNNFVYKYNDYFKYYYRDTKIPKSMRPPSQKTINDTHTKNKNDTKVFNTEYIHDKRRIILPRIFHESLIRAALLFYSNSKNKEEKEMKLSKKLQNILNILIPSGLKKRATGSFRSSHSKLEQSFNTSVAVIENKNKIQEYHLTAEFMSLFFNELKNLFNKFYLITNINKPKIGDRTIQYRDFYNKIILHKKNDNETDDKDKDQENLIRKIIPNKFVFIELITEYFKEKTNLASEENKKDCTQLYDYVNSLFSREMIEYEFNELIFLICKRYFSIKNLKGTYNEYKEIIDAICKIVNKLEIPKNCKKKYFYPVLNSHIIKQRLIDEENARIEAERRRKRERERYIRERELMDKEENENAFNEKNTFEEEEDDYDDIEDDNLLE